MKHILHKKGWIYRAVQIHVDPSTIPIIKIKFDAMVEKFMLGLYLSEILHQRGMVCMNLEWPCLTMDI